MPDPSLKQDIVFTAKLRGHDLTFHSTWGLFSPKAIDEGTRLLLDHLQIEPTDSVLDLGCGYGPLGIAIAKLTSGSVDMVDKDFVAVDFANKNAQLNHTPAAKAYLSNGFDQVPAGRKFDVIVSNVPAKIGKELLEIMLRDAHDRLNPGGRLYLVTVSGLKDYMKRNLTIVFGNYDKLKQSKTYTAALSIRQ